MSQEGRNVCFLLKHYSQKTSSQFSAPTKLKQKVARDVQNVKSDDLSSTYSVSLPRKLRGRSMCILEALSGRDEGGG